MASPNRSTIAGITVVLAVALVVGWLMRVGPPGTAAPDAATTDAGTPAPPGASGLPVPDLPDLNQLPAYAAVDPAWTFYDLEGRPVTLGDLQGRVVVINFWATWCAPCLVEMPALEQLAGAIDREKTEVLLISSESPEIIREFQFEQGGDLPVYIADTSPPPALNVPYLPSTFILNPAGEIVFRHVGAADWNHPSVRSFIWNLTQTAS